MAGEEMNQPSKTTHVPEQSDLKVQAEDGIDMNEKPDIISQAKLATEIEHTLTTLEAIKAYPMAIFWGSIFATSLIMVGYDSGIIYSFYALPAFVKKYGTYYGPAIGYEVSAKWQNVLGMGTPVGQFLGAFTASYPMERWGRKKVFAGSLFLTTSFVFIQMFASNVNVLAAGEFLAGVLYGTYVVLAPTYVSEVCPVALRGIMNAGMNLAYVIGQFIASGVGDGVSTWTTQWAYRLPFAIQWVWIPLLGSLLWFAPESPYWLVRQGRHDEAEASLRRLVRSSSGVDVKASLAMIEATTLHEIEVEKSTTYLECFRGSNRIRTEVALMVQTWQVITGISFIGYAVYFFELAGLPVKESFDMGVGNTAIGFVATCSSWFLMSYAGRRTIFMTGVGIMAVSLVLIGILDCLPNYTQRPGIAWAQAGLLDFLTFVFQGSVGPINFVIFAEIGSTRLRSQTCALATSTGSIFQIIMTVAFPYMINGSAANWRGKIGFFFGGISILATIWCWFRLPETKGRTYEELDFMFEAGIPVRKFGAYKFEEIEGQEEHDVV
jgi:SP family general alpha glucoside:H+ symporter-like MFS transporter